AADKEDGAPVSSVQVLIDGQVVGNATLGRARPDVASAFGDSRYTNSGWSFSYNIGNLAAGSHTVTAVATDSAGASSTLPPSPGAGTITVTANTSPFGHLEEATGTNGSTSLAQNSTLIVGGW